MENFTKKIINIIINETDVINEKLKGLHFLETLKLKLIGNIIPVINSYNPMFDQLIEFESKYEKNQRRLNLSINYYNKPISISRKKIDNDSLFISFNETINIDIYKDKNLNEFKSLYLYKNTGLCLPKNTLINAKFNKNTVLVEIKNKDLGKSLTK